jgi:hypothetical protein
MWRSDIKETQIGGGKSVILLAIVEYVNSFLCLVCSLAYLHDMHYYLLSCHYYHHQIADIIVFLTIIIIIII